MARGSFQQHSVTLPVRTWQCGAGIPERGMSTWGTSPTWNSLQLCISRKSRAERSCSQQSMLDLSPLFKDCELAKGASLFYSDPFDCGKRVWKYSAEDYQEEETALPAQ